MLDDHAVSRYVSLDLGSDGLARKELEEAVQSEAKSSHIKLTDLVGDSPPNLTPEMLTWYDIHVRSIRKAALDAVDAQLSAMSKGRKAAGVLLERQLDKIEDTRIAQKRQTLASHQQKNAAGYVELNQAREAEENARIRYENLELRHNRAPRLPPWWYIPVLFLLLPAEGAINYETFMAVSWMTPALALGTVVVIGFLLTLSAHMYGTLLRQARVLFDPAEDDIDRLVGWRMLGIGTLSLAVVLGVVWYFRSAYFADMMRTIIVMGGEAPSAFLIIGGSLLGNVAVWLCGVILAFLLHDPDPHFPKSMQDWKKKGANANRLQKALAKPLQREFEKIEAVAKREKEQAENQGRAMSHLVEYQEARKLFSRIAEQDARGLALLSLYRGKLLNSMRDSDARFEKWKESGVEETEFLTGSQYAAEPLKLKYL